MKKFEFEVEGTKTVLEDKSHAGIFRKFWAHFFNEDLDKTVDTIELVGIRTSDQPLFVAKNGAKKKNIEVPAQGDLYIYTHLTPKAMHKAYDKFIKGWEGKWQADAPADADDKPKKEKKSPAPKEEKVDKPKEEVQEELPLSNTKEEPKQDKTPEEIAKDEISMEEYGTPYSELMPSMKGVVSKKYKKMQKQEA